MKAYCISLSLSDSPHLAWESLGPSMLPQMTRFQCGLRAVSYSIVYLSSIHLIFFVHSSIENEHLSYFHILANAAMNIWVHVSFRVSVFVFFEKKYPKVDLLDHMVVLFLIFWGNFVLFSIVAMPIHSPSNTARRCLFLHILCGLFDDRHSNGCEVVSHCSFDLYFPNN